VSVKETGGSVVSCAGSNRERRPQLRHRSREAGGLPNEVVVRAREVLAEHESSEHRSRSSDAGQFHRAGAAHSVDHLHATLAAVLEKLREVDLNRLTPLEALNLLAR